MRATLAALIVAALAAGAAPADDKDNAGKSDLDRMQGKWTAKAGPDKDYTVVMEIKDKAVNSTITTPQGQEYRLKGEVKVDDKASPKQLDWIKFTKPDGGEYEPNLAIYKFDGDTLVVCSGGPGRDRPTEFKEGTEGRPSLLEFKPVKDDKKDEPKKAEAK